MLVKCMLDPTALTAEDPDSGRTKATHLQAIELLLTHGVVVYGSIKDQDAFLSAIEDLPQTLRKLWKEALVYVPVERSDPEAPVPLALINRIEDLRGATAITLLLSEETRAWVLGLPESDMSFVDDTSDIEIARFDCARHAERFHKVITLNKTDVPKGADRNEVWKGRFEPLVATTSTVTIVDRYAGEGVAESRSGTGGRPGRGDKGLEWFLRKVSSVGRKNVHIYTSLHKASVSDVAHAFSNLVGTLPQLGELKVTIAPDSVFKHQVHTRHARFGRHHALLVEPGLGVFSQKLTPKSFPLPLTDTLSAMGREAAIRKERVYESLIGPPL